jgi:ligand-binding SRPBCC domain-containing protein
VLPAALTAVGFRWAYPELGPAVAEALRGDPDAVTLGPAPAELPSSAYLRARPPRYTLTARTVIDRPLDEVFEFFCAAANLGAITPPDMAFRIVTPQPIAMAEGTVIDYRIRATGVPMSWRTVIDVWEPPAGGRARFVDSQVRGPYACWWHEHRFEADGRAHDHDRHGALRAAARAARRGGQPRHGRPRAAPHLRAARPGDPAAVRRGA